MSEGLTKALGIMMKSIPQIAQLQHRIFELAVKPDGMLHPLHPKIGWRNHNETVYFTESRKDHPTLPSGLEQTPFGLRPNAN